MKTKTKTKSCAHLDRNEIDNLVYDYAHAFQVLTATTTYLDRDLAKVRAQYEHDIARASARAVELRSQIQSWAEANRDQFAGKKTLNLIHGTLSFRTGTPALKPLRGWTWKTVLENLKRWGNQTGFIRIKEEVNKEAILAARALPVPRLDDLGLRVTQAETFEIKPVATKIDQPVSASA